MTDLRTATSAQHSTLESLVPFIYLTNDKLTAHYYYQALKILHAWYNDIEQPTYHALPENFSERYHWLPLEPYLTMDICNTKEVASKPFTLTETPYEQYTSSYALGQFYVLLGSALGAKLILKHLKNWQQETGCQVKTYYYEEIVNRIGMWKTYQCYLSNNEGSVCREELIAGAVEGFDKLIQQTSQSLLKIPEAKTG